MNGIYRNILVMSFILVGVIGFYLKHQGLFGRSLLKMLLIYSTQSLGLAIILILVLHYLWGAHQHVARSS